MRRRAVFLFYLRGDVDGDTGLRSDIARAATGAPQVKTCVGKADAPGKEIRGAARRRGASPLFLTR